MCWLLVLLPCCRPMLSSFGFALGPDSREVSRCAHNGNFFTYLLTSVLLLLLLG